MVLYEHFVTWQFPTLAPKRVITRDKHPFHWKRPFHEDPFRERWQLVFNEYLKPKLSFPNNDIALRDTSTRRVFIGCHNALAEHPLRVMDSGP